MRRFAACVSVFRPTVVARCLGLAAAGLLLSSATVPLTGCLSRSLTGLSIEPVAGATCVYPGAIAQYRAYGIYTESGHATVTKEITDQVDWSVTFPTLASVNSEGVVTAGLTAVGTSNVIASTQGAFGIVHDTSSIQVSSSCTTSAIARGPSSMAIVPATATLLQPGESEQPMALGISSGVPQITNLSRVTWQSSDPGVATVTAQGIIHAVAPGKAVITARSTMPDGRVITGSQTVVFPAAAQ